MVQGTTTQQASQPGKPGDASGCGVMPAATRAVPGATFPCSSTEQRGMDQSMSKPIFLPHVQGKKPSSERAGGLGSTGDALRWRAVPERVRCLVHEEPCGELTCAGRHCGCLS